MARENSRAGGAGKSSQDRQCRQGRQREYHKQNEPENNLAHSHRHDVVREGHERLEDHGLSARDQRALLSRSGGRDTAAGKDTSVWGTGEGG